MNLVASINQRLGIGESEAIALAVEINADYVLLDDFAARKEAKRLGLNVKGTLAVIQRLRQDRKIKSVQLEDLYIKITEINFRVSRSIFDQIFVDD
jgi:predicted nucleic acid-binding protein